MTNTRIGLALAGREHEIFRLEERLGAGSFGEVYRAVGTASGTVVAVKMVPENKLADPATLAVRTMLNETRPKMLEVDHPNVVRVLHVDAGTDPTIGPYVMMEFVEGGNLQQMLDGRRKTHETLPLDDALDLMRQIALGAQAVNEHLVHRDIKPDNILLDASTSPPRPRIADFGVAKVTAEATRPTAETLKGVQPVWYMAPEAWRDETHTWRMDVYSVGLVFYEILTLDHPLLKHVSQPWDHVRWSKVHQAIPCEDVRNARGDVPLALAKLLLRMVDKSPGNRPNWDEVIVGLDPRPATQAADAALDPALVAVFKRRADEQFRDDQRRAAEDLKRREHSDKNEIVRDEVRQSGKRLIARFDCLSYLVASLEWEDEMIPPAFACFIHFGAHATDGLLVRLLGDDALQRRLFGESWDEERLAQALLAALRYANGVTNMGFLWPSRSVIHFLEQHDVAAGRS